MMCFQRTAASFGDIHEVFFCVCRELHLECIWSSKGKVWLKRKIKLKPLPAPPHPVCRVILREIRSQCSFNCLYRPPHLQQYNKHTEGDMCCGENMWLKDRQARENTCLTHTTGKPQALSCSMERFVWSSSIRSAARLWIIGDSTIKLEKLCRIFRFQGSSFHDNSQTQLNKWS